MKNNNTSVIDDSVYTFELDYIMSNTGKMHWVLTIIRDRNSIKVHTSNSRSYLLGIAKKYGATPFAWKESRLEGKVENELKKDILCKILKDLEMRIEWGLAEVFDKKKAKELLAPIRAHLNSELETSEKK